MDDAERPAKLRKLTHEDDATGNVQSLVEQTNDIQNAQLTASATAPEIDQNHDNNTESSCGDDGHVHGDADVGNEIDLAGQLSKNQQKKLRKRQEWEAGRDYRKAKRKQKAVEKKARLKEARNAEKPSTTTSNQQTKRRRHVRVPITIILDCGFDGLMMEKERISLGSQLTRAYSDNQNAEYQVHLAVSSWGGLLKERFDTVLNKHYLNWRAVHFEEDGFTAVSEKAKTWMAGKLGGKLAGYFEKHAISTSEKPLVNGQKDTVTGTSDLDDKDKSGELWTQRTNEEDGMSANPPDLPLHDTSSNTEGEVIYLTSDSPDTLDALKPYSTYIVGGLVDKNRHKGICYKTALDKGVKTAKLPIGEYMNMQSRFVLATNHVVEIMLRWLVCGDWGEAFMQVIPKRKGGSLKGEHGEAVEAVEAVEAEQQSPSNDPA